MYCVLLALLRFTRDMLPYWYRQMIHNKMGRTFQRGQGGDNLVYKHEKFFILGHFQTGYHPVLNIRLGPVIDQAG